MANTFKFGNGNFAVKDGFALAYNDENNNFKPLPFDFTRASTATRVNKDGLIETVPSGKPRIDFLNNTSGHLLLEPSRTNSILYSEDFSNASWLKYDSVSVTINDSISPDGNNTATTLSNATGTSRNSNVLQFNASGLSSSTAYTFSVYVKSTNTTNVQLGLFDATTGVNNNQDFTVTSSWQRISFTATTGASTTFFNAYIGDTSGDISIWAAQLEAGSYATSYIPTEGSSVTRVVDDIDLTLPDVDAFNSSSGFSVIAKFDIGETGSGTSAPFILFNDDTSSTYIGFGTTSTNFRCRLNLSGSAYLNTQSNAPRTQRNSLFVSCDSSGWSQGANGSTNHTGSNDASVFDKMASITFLTDELRGIIKISELLVYNTRLTNTELQTLTS